MSALSNKARQAKDLVVMLRGAQERIEVSFVHSSFYNVIKVRVDFVENKLIKKHGIKLFSFYLNHEEPLLNQK